MDKIILSHSTKNVFNALCSLGNYELEPYFFELKTTFLDKEITQEEQEELSEIRLSFFDLVVYEKDGELITITDGKKGLCEDAYPQSPKIYRIKNLKKNGFFFSGIEDSFKKCGFCVDDHRVGYWVEDNCDSSIPFLYEDRRSIKISFFIPKAKHFDPERGKR